MKDYISTKQFMSFPDEVQIAINNVDDKSRKKMSNHFTKYGRLLNSIVFNRDKQLTISMRKNLINYVYFNYLEKENQFEQKFIKTFYLWYIKTKYKEVLRMFD